MLIFYHIFPYSYSIKRDENMTKATGSPTYVRPDNTAVITCPHCGRQKTIQGDSVKGHRHKFKVKCTCKNVFIVNLEFRKRKRKPTNLRGTYINHSQQDSNGNIIVKNLSVSGLEFTSYDHKDFKVDDELTVSFTLDDEHLSEITKEIIVKDIRKNSVGCEFVRSGEMAFDGPLGFYVMH